MRFLLYVARVYGGRRTVERGEMERKSREARYTHGNLGEERLRGRQSPFAWIKIEERGASGAGNCFSEASHSFELALLLRFEFYCNFPWCNEKIWKEGIEIEMSVERRNPELHRQLKGFGYAQTEQRSLQIHMIFSVHLLLNCTLKNG